MTLQCGEQVQITGRYEATSASDRQGKLVMCRWTASYVQGQAGANQPKRYRKARERAHSVRRTPHTPANSCEGGPERIRPYLANGMPIHVKLGKTISTASAQVGDVVELQVIEEFVVDGVTVIPIGATATGIVWRSSQEAIWPRRKLSLSINFVRLGNNEKRRCDPSREHRVEPDSWSGRSPSPRKRHRNPQGTDFTA